MNNSQFSLANRKQLADMLGDKYDSLRRKTKQKFASKREVLFKALVTEYAGKKGATALVGQIAKIHDELEMATRKLAVLGFRVDSDGEVSIEYGRHQLRHVIEERIDNEIGKLEDIDARFDAAQVQMMTVASLEDAEKLLKSVQEI